MNKISKNRSTVSPAQVQFGKKESQVESQSLPQTDPQKSIKILMGFVIGLVVVTICLQVAGITYYALTKDAKNSTSNLTDNSAALDTLILTSTEKNTLNGWTKANKYTLLYRGSRDGYTAWDFHSKCDGFNNTITVIKTTTDNVFGGFSVASWDSFSGFKEDANAYVFSLRLAGASNNLKFSIDSAFTKDAIYCFQNFGPTFGSGHDINVVDKCDVFDSKISCESYDCSKGSSYLNGGLNAFLVSEIEVFQIS